MMDLSVISRMAWADVELEVLAWVEEGRDLVLHLRVPGDDDTRRKRVVTCRWTEGLATSLKFPNGRGGYPLTWAVTFNALADGRCSIMFDFGDSGAIRFVCADIQVA